MSSPAEASQYETVLQQLGQGIVDGVYPAGSVIPSDELQAQWRVSRSIFREAIRTLTTLGLVKAQRSVGTTVLPASEWATIHPMVIRWRAHGPDYMTQHRELLEMRLGIEPVSAELAAARAPVETGAKLLFCAAAMKEAFLSGGAEEFFEADSSFHQALLEGSGNAVLAKQAEPVASALRARIESGRDHLRRLVRDSLDRHVFLAEAVADGDTARARMWSEMIIRYTLIESSANQDFDETEFVASEGGKDESTQ